MDEEIILHHDFWKNKLIPQFLGFEGLDESIQKRAQLIQIGQGRVEQQFNTFI